MNSKRITGLADPVNPQDAVTQAWVGANVTGGALIADSAPAAGKVGNLWWDSDQGNLYLRYDDGSSVQWVQVNVASPAAMAVTNIVKTVITASQGYTKPAALKFLELEGQAAGGGGGGGAAAPTGAGSAGSGGGAGGYFRHFLPAVSVPATLTLTIGAAGAGGAGTGGAGAGAGGNLTVSELSLTAFGGAGGTSGGATNTGLYVQGGAGGSASGANQLNLMGGTGELAIYMTGGVCAGGFGGISMFGRGRPVTGGNMPANTIVNAGAGGSGTGVGSGGAGATGAQGGPGVLILTEYF